MILLILCTLSLCLYRYHRVLQRLRLCQRGSVWYFLHPVGQKYVGIIQIHRNESDYQR